jgi:hypothetical protein
LTPILPIVFHTAPRVWGSNRTLADLMRDCPEELRAFAPTWPVVFWDLAQRTPSQLLAADGPFVQLLALVRAEERDAETFREVFRQLMRQLGPLAEQDKMRWRDLLWLAVSWVIQRPPESEHDDLVAEAQASQADQAAREEVKKVSDTIERTWAEALEARVRRESIREALLEMLADLGGPVPEALAQ